MDDIRAQVRGELTGPGGFFETSHHDVLGETLEVFSNRKRSLRDLVADALAQGETEFLVLDDERITYEQFVHDVASVAAALSDRYHVAPGDRVAILAANCPEWIIAFFATVSLGGVVAALNGWWTADEVGYGLDLSEPALLIGDERRLARLSHLELRMPVVEIESEFAALRRYDRDRGLPTVPIAEDDPALILFTSGTTGRPKGAYISHRGLVGFVQGNFASGAERMFLQARLGEEPSAPRGQMITLATSPLFHVSGLFGSTLMGISVGAKLVFRRGAFDPVDVLRLIEAERVTSWSALGSMGPRLLSCGRLGDFDLSSVNNVGFGGAPLAPDLQRRLREAFPNASPGFSMGYGSSESVGVITSIAGQDFLDRPTSAGRANITFGLEIRDEDGRPQPEGVEGEIHVRSPYTMLGYFRNHEATDATIKPGRWLAMGDIGRLEDGWLYINSRARDMILRAAENIYPAEIEHRLDAHPAVHESAVIGVDHPELGQEVMAIVVPEVGARLDVDELAAWCARTLAPYKVPSRWEIRLEPLPRNAVGKVVKGVLTGERDLGMIEE